MVDDNGKRSPRFTVLGLGQVVALNEASEAIFLNLQTAMQRLRCSYQAAEWQSASQDGVRPGDIETRVATALRDTKLQIQQHTDELIVSWQGIETDFTHQVSIELELCSLNADIVVSKLGSWFIQMQEQLWQILLNYCHVIADELLLESDEKQQLSDMLYANGLAGVWRLMSILREITPNTTSNLTLSAPNLQYRLSSLFMLLHTDPAHYVEDLAQRLAQKWGCET